MPSGHRNLTPSHCVRNARPGMTEWIDGENERLLLGNEQL